MSTLVATNSHAPLVVPLMKNMARERSGTHMYFKHGTYSLCVIHQGCLVPVGVTPQSSSSSQQLSDWIWHWSIISLFFEWSGRGKEKERDMRRQTPREKLEREGERAGKESDFYHWACNNWERWVQWQPLPSGSETAVYTAHRMGYRPRQSIGTGPDRLI